MKIDCSQIAESTIKGSTNIKIPVTGDSISPVFRTGNMVHVLMICISVFLSSSVFASAPDLNTDAGEKHSSYTMESGIPEYLIAATDVLEIRIWRGFEEKKHEVIVKPDGYIMVAYVSIKVSDFTVRQAEAELRKELLEYIKEPRVEIMIKEYKGRSVTLLGAVQTQVRQPTGPGIYALKGKTTLSRLSIRAGGFAKEADLRNVRITSTDGTIKKINVFEIMFAGEISNDIIIDSGDIIYVPFKEDTEDYNIFVLGEVRKPGIYKLTPKLTLLQSLVKAGGYKEVALIEEIRIIRGGLDNPEFILANTEAILEKGDTSKDVFLQNKDIIYVPKTKIGSWNAFIKKIRPTFEFLTLPFSSLTRVNGQISGDE